MICDISIRSRERSYRAGKFYSPNLLTLKPDLLSFFKVRGYISLEGSALSSLMVGFLPPLGIVDLGFVSEVCFGC